MKVKLSTPIVDLQGNQANNESNQPVTVKDVLLQSLVIGGRAAQISQDEKYKQFKLLMSINSSKTDSMDFSSEEVTLLKSLVHECYPVLVYGQTVDILESK